jgi:hypothetical protein
MGNCVRSDLEGALEYINMYEKSIHTLVTAVLLPSGAKEIAINTDMLKEKIEYILSAYDGEMRLKTNNNIVMIDVMVIY